MMKQYDFIIVGGGIAGLYAAYKIKTMNPNASVIVLEKQHKKWAGGRTGNDNFRGTSIVTGAGIGRKRKDKLLIKLLKDMGVETHEFEAKHNYAATIKEPCAVKNTFLEIKRAYSETAAKGKTFKEFAISVIGLERYKHFTICAGYTDYEEEDAHSTLFNYGFDDNYENWTGIAIPWRTLIMKLIEKIGVSNVHFGCEVTNIKIVADGFIVDTNSKTYYGRKVIIATTIEGVLKLVPESPRIYKQIHGQPFLRTYGKFSASSLNTMREYVPYLTIVPGALQKIIPMDADRGVYMICYSDNASAKKLDLISEDSEENRARFCRLLEKSLDAPKDSLELLEIADYYWATGTHYYEPLTGDFKNRGAFIRKAQRPHRNMLVVGELISTNQGWVEGALESVEAVVTERWINK